VFVALAAIAAGAGAQDVPQQLLYDANSIQGFELYSTGLYWWSNHGVCTGEFPHNATIRWRGTVTGTTRTLADSCMMLEGAVDRPVRDGTYMYFFKDARLQRKALNAGVNNPPSIIPNSPTLPAPHYGTILELGGSMFFWSSYDWNTRLNTVWTMPVDGSAAPEQLFVSSIQNVPLRKMVWRQFDDGDGNTIEALFLLSDNGTFTRKLLSPAGGETVIANTVTDFCLISTYNFMSIRTTIYATTGTFYPVEDSPPGQLLKINAYSLDSTVLYTAAGTNPGNQLLGVATDSGGFIGPMAPDKHVYISEGAVECDMFCYIAGISLHRGGLSGGSWDMIAAADGGWNLRSDDQTLYFIADDRIWTISTGAPAVELDIQAGPVEVDQIGNRLDNSVPLIANRTTYVRAYAHTVLDTTGKTNWQPNATLRGFRGSQELDGSPLTKVNIATIDSTSDMMYLRPELDRSFLFRLPDAWTAAGELELEFEVNPGDAPVETGGATNFTNVTVTFHQKGRPAVYFVPVFTDECPIFSPTLQAGAFLTILSRARSLLPIEDFTVLLADNALWNGNRPYDFNPGKDDYNEDGLALDVLAALYYIMNFPATGAIDQVVGMVNNQQPWRAGGVAYGHVPVLLAKMAIPSGLPRHDGPWSGYVLAHESGHNYQRGHIQCPSSGDGMPAGPYDWPPFDVCDIGPTGDPAEFYGFDPLSRDVIMPSAASDLMSYQDPKWISAYTWEAMYARTPNTAGAGWISEPGAGPDRQAPAGDSLLVRGVVAADGASGQLYPCYLLPDTAASAGAGHAARQEYAIRLLDGAGAVLAEVPLEIAISWDTAEPAQGFAAAIPWDERAAAVTLNHGETLLAARTVSANDPVLELAEPEVDSSAQSLLLHWKAYDPDPVAEVTVLAQYSPDGETWVTIGLDIEQPGMAVSTRQLPGGTQARIRLFATDGLNTASAMSAPFTLNRHAPQPLIAGVANDARVHYGQLLELQGMAFDADEGSLTSDRLSWAVDGPADLAGTGSQLPMDGAAPGSYRAVLTATDSDSMTASAQLEFEILPLRIPEATAANLDGLCDDSCYAMAPVIQLPISSGKVATVRLAHVSGRLYICFNGLARGSGSITAAAGARFDTDNGREEWAQAEDRGFFITEEGVPFQTAGTGEAMPETLTPVPGCAAVIALGTAEWSAEFAIDDAALGGWEHYAGLMVEQDRLPNGRPSGWPATAASASPATWAPVYLGSTLPTLPNRKPVALAGENQVLVPGPEAVVYLDGTASYDPDGDQISYLWTLVQGPPVSLSDNSAATPYFAVAQVSDAVRYVFRLTVNDGFTESDAASVSVTLQPGLPAAAALGVDLLLPHYISPGGSFYVSAVLTNPGAIEQNLPFFCLLGVFGEYYFYPTWVKYPPDIAYELIDVPHGVTVKEVLPPFSWPDVDGELSGLYFYGAFLNREMSEIYGDLDAEEWGYGQR